MDTNVDHSEVVIEGIEIDNGIKLVPRVPRMPPAADTDDSATKTLDFQTDDSAAWDQFEQETAQIHAVTEPVPTLVQSKPVVASKPKKDRKKKKAPADPDRAERRKRVGMISLGAVALLGLFLVWQNWSDGPDGREAYAVFRRVGTAFETNSESMNDNEWALFIRDSRKEVNAVLEPLRDEVSSDYPESQALMWAGDKLIIMLKGARIIPGGIKRQFESYMAEYNGEPIPSPKPPADSDVNNGEPMKKEILDPMFDP